MNPSFKKELNSLIRNPKSLLSLSEFDIRNNILKLFNNLGWNVYNNNLQPFDYEVLQENTIKNGRPDLVFIIGGEKKFYIETKKASIDMAERDVWQTWKYAWNSGLPFSVLSNFTCTYLLDCRSTPPNEPPKRWKDLVIKAWKIERYISDFDDIKSILGRIEVEKGSLSKLEEEIGQGKIRTYDDQPTLFPFKGIQQVDELFLRELDIWRFKIAQNLHSRRLKIADIASTTDNILNFFVFVRFLEDRGLLHEETLKQINDNRLEKKGTLTRELKTLKSNLNLIYNGTVFKETEHEFSVDEQILSEIIYNLYSPQSPYQFDYISIDILGTIYERFLSRRITEDAKRGILYSDESDSKKAQKEGGVYYTERYITNFMTNRILRRALDPRKPEDVFNLKIADITCGSGSFLITAYKAIMFWFENICIESSDLREKYLVRLQNGKWKLKLECKIKLLENCIHGVDIDSESVEVTKFSLYLQLLESETEDDIKEFFNKRHIPILPILNNNIQCGNSLVEYDIVEHNLFTNDIQKIINPFNLKESFKEVFDNGGFDIIIGNPPYSAKLQQLEKDYCKRYELAKGNLNSANLFINRVDTLTKQNGQWTLIIPKSLIYSEKWILTRNYLRNNLFYAVDASKAFKNVRLEQVIIGHTSEPESFTTGSINKDGFHLFDGHRCLSFSDIIPVNIGASEIEIGEKIIKNSISIGENFKLKRGIVTLSSLRETGDVKVFQGKFIQGYHFMDPDKGISEEEIIPLYDQLMIPKLMFQQIVSHSLVPKPHIRLVGSVDLDGNKLSIDTVSNIFIHKRVTGLKQEESLLLALAILNSRIMNWFVDRFIYGRAIRTMHFDNYQLNKMRFPSDVTNPIVEKIIMLTKNMLSLDIQEKSFKNRSRAIEKLINSHVAELFGLSKHDREHIDVDFGDEYLCDMGLLGKLNIGIFD
ncbi:MAG: Type IIS restriction enzyme Eco57I [Firmicutes bacterium ADurb.Bin080]|nr:MAG: Type IIS restriction enzyme Eco57I [Firmicutes bacterium ADurb.Bin080]